MSSVRSSARAEEPSRPFPASVSLPAGLMMIGAPKYRMGLKCFRFVLYFEALGSNSSLYSVRRQNAYL